MRRLAAIFFAIALISKAFAQEPTVLDTVFLDHGPIVIYSDGTWEDIAEMHGGSLHNDFLYGLLCEDTNICVHQSWSNDKLFGASLDSNRLELLNDTLMMCVLHEGDSVCIPFPGAITSRFKWRHGRYHKGIDIDLEEGDTVVAAFDGVVRWAKYHNGGFGNLVIVRHGNGFETYYAHFSKILVKPNQWVAAGTPIGLGGKTGRAYGTHLHFEVRIFDNAIDPEHVFDFEQKTVTDTTVTLHKGLFPYKQGATYSDGSSSSSSSSSSSGSSYHTIRSGDTLSGIARKYHTSVSTLCRLNGIKPTTILHIGRKLKIR